MGKIKKRFIAGATCQNCGLADCLQLIIEGEKETVQCVECGVSMAKPLANHGSSSPELIAVIKPQ